MPFDSTPRWYIMAKPPPWQRRAMHFPDWACPRRGADLLHSTVLPLKTWAELGCDMETLVAALWEIEADPFVLVLDRAEGRCGGTAELACSKIPAAARRLRAAVVAALRRNGIAADGEAKLRSHVTLNYAWRQPAFRTAIEPIPWLIDEVLLIESLTGKTEHVAHGRFPVTPRQGMLFPLTHCSAARPRRGGGTLALPCR